MTSHASAENSTQYYLQVVTSKASGENSKTKTRPPNEKKAEEKVKAEERPRPKKPKRTGKPVAKNNNTMSFLHL